MRQTADMRKLPEPPKSLFISASNLVDSPDVLKVQLVNPNGPSVAADGDLVVARPPGHRPHPLVRLTNRGQTNAFLILSKPGRQRNAVSSAQ